MTYQAMRLPLAVTLLIALTGAALAQGTVTIENLTSRSADAKTELAIARIEAVNTNLSRDELTKLFSGETPRDEALALAVRMRADRLAVTGAVVTSEDGRMSFGPFEATGIEGGRFSKATLASFSGGFSGKGKGKDAGGSVTGRTLRLEQGDFAPLIRAVQTNDVDAGSLKIGRIAWDGFEGTFTDPETPPSAPGGNQIKVSLGSLSLATQYKENTPVNSKAEVVGFRFDPAPASAFARGLRDFGYDRIELGLTGAGRYDPATQRLALENYEIASPKAGRLTLAGDLSGIDPSALSSKDTGQRTMALLGSGVEALRIHFVNDGLVEKSFAYAAAQQGKSPAALRSEVSAMSAQLLPLLLGGDPQSLALAQSVQTFLATPRSFDLSLKARGAPVPLARLGAIRDPATFFALVEVNLSVNQ